MFNLCRFQFKDPEDLKWGILIVLSALAIPVLLYIIGFRLGERRIATPGARWALAAALCGGWFLMSLAPPYSPNFALFLMRWLCFPLVLQ